MRIIRLAAIVTHSPPRRGRWPVRARGGAGFFLCILGLAAGSACGFGQSAPSGSAPRASSARTAAPGRTPSSAAGAAWVIATVPVQLHSAPDLASSRITLLSWGEHVQVTSTRRVGTDTFAQVKADDGTEGWVVDRPDILIHRSVSKYIGTAFQMLYPSEWSTGGTNPVTFASPSADREGITLLAQTAADTPQLPPVPLRQGQKLGDDSVQVGNPTYVLHSYKLDAGGFESYVSFKQGNTAYLFDFKQNKGSQPDTTLFKVLLGTVIVSG
jgi:Bacterial SH3 domain